MLEDFRLKVFVTLAQQKSFTKAASVLGISQPAVSNHILELEKALGVKVFQRQRGETVLTESGKVFLKHAYRILSDYERIAVEFSAFQPVQVRISAAEEIFDHVTEVLLADFSALHPEVTFLKSFPEDADLKVSLRPADKEKGMFALSLHPSESFAGTRLWSVLSDTLKPAL